MLWERIPTDWMVDGMLALRESARVQCGEAGASPDGEWSTTGASLFVFGIRAIDDIVMRRRDAKGTGTAEERRYCLTDANDDVYVIVADAGYGVGRVFYTACGEPAVFPFRDAIGDCIVDGTGAKSTFGRGTIRRTTKFMAGRIRRSLLSTFPPPAAASPRRSG